MEVHHLKKAEFDHGGTRKKAAELSGADIMVFMTQDALPADENLIENLTAPLKARARRRLMPVKLPNASCGFVERYTRSFNYPEQSSVKSAADLPVYGDQNLFLLKRLRGVQKRDL